MDDKIWIRNVTRNSTDAIFINIGLVGIRNFRTIIQVILNSVEIRVVARVASVTDAVVIGIILKLNGIYNEFVTFSTRLLLVKDYK